MLNCAQRANGKGSRLTRATVQRQELIPCVLSLWGGLDRVTGSLSLAWTPLFTPLPGLGDSDEHTLASGGRGRAVV